jgi:hypothetical protein
MYPLRFSVHISPKLSFIDTFFRLSRLIPTNLLLNKTLRQMNFLIIPRNSFKASCYLYVCFPSKFYILTGIEHNVQFLHFPLACCICPARRIIKQEMKFTVQFGLSAPGLCGIYYGTAVLCISVRKVMGVPDSKRGGGV